MALSLHHGERVILDQVGGFADGVAVKEVGEETFRLCKELIDGVVLVSRDAICASIKVTFLSFLIACMWSVDVSQSSISFSFSGLRLLKVILLAFELGYLIQVQI